MICSPDAVTKLISLPDIVFLQWILSWFSSLFVKQIKSSVHIVLEIVDVLMD